MTCRQNTWANFWLCSCNVKWHQCEVHSLDPEVHSEIRQSRKRQALQQEPAQAPKKRQSRGRKEEVLPSQESDSRAEKRSCIEEGSGDDNKHPKRKACRTSEVAAPQQRVHIDAEDADVATWDINFLQSPCEEISMSAEEFRQWVDEQGSDAGGDKVLVCLPHVGFIHRCAGGSG